MDPRMIAAQFAAYTWFTEYHPEATNEDAVGYALKNWKSFLGQAPAGLGRLLIRVGRLKSRRLRQRPVLCSAAAG